MRNNCCFTAKVFFNCSTEPQDIPNLHFGLTEADSGIVQKVVVLMARHVVYIIFRYLTRVDWPNDVVCSS